MSKYLDENFQKLLFAGTRGQIKDNPLGFEKYVLQTGVCRELAAKLARVQTTLDPSKKYSQDLSAKAYSKIESLDKKILIEMKKHKLISSVITSPMDTDIVIESNHPVLKFARKWLGIKSPIDRDYSGFLQDVAEHPRKDIYVAKVVSKEDQFNTEKTKKMYADVQNQIAFSEKEKTSNA